MQQPQDMVQGILSARFQPDYGDYSNAIMKTINGAPTSGMEAANSRLANTMGILGEIDKMNQLQLALGKFNIDQMNLEETMRHNRATEASNPNALPISTSPMPSGGLNPMMGNLIQAESGGNPNAVSPSGARGLTQVMPATAANPGFGVKPMQNNSPEEQIRFGNDYLNAMQQRYNDPRLAAAAYNAGPGRVDAALNRLPSKTQNYVQKVAGQPGVTTGQGTPQVQPLYRGNQPMTENLDKNFQWGMGPNGQMVATQIPGTVIKGDNGKIQTINPDGTVTESIPQDPVARQKFEQNLQMIADKFNQLHKLGGTIESGDDTASNKFNQLKATKPGQMLMEGTDEQMVRGEIQDLIKKTVPLYMQAMGITPGMERAVAAQQMLQEALGGSVGKSRQQNQFSLSTLSKQAGTGELGNKFDVLQSARDAIKKGASVDAVSKRLLQGGYDPSEL